MRFYWKKIDRLINIRRTVHALHLRPHLVTNNFCISLDSNDGIRQTEFESDENGNEKHSPVSAQRHWYRSLNHSDCPDRDTSHPPRRFDWRDNELDVQRSGVRSYRRRYNCGELGDALWRFIPFAGGENFRLGYTARLLYCKRRFNSITGFVLFNWPRRSIPAETFFS